ncbi:FAD dependent oxidoreductase [Xylaria flabelliformis]|nr:FAD dependent oxidoreductase [Xylaria flabelliformis]
MTVFALPPEPQSTRAELPSPNSTHSYWHRDPSKLLFNHRTTPDLPSTADVIVIGSGISGTFAARELTAAGRSVVMLEAREACWGATGRNGGHCQPTVWDSAEEVARFELGTFDLIRDLVARHAVPCDWHVVGGIHVIYSQEVLEAAEKQIRRLQKHPDLRDKAVLITDREELAANHVPDALGAIFQPNAAKLWPYKLVAWALEGLLAEHGAAVFNLQTNTPVTRLARRRGPSSSWVAHTPRGEIGARQVLLAVNGYASYLLPGLTDVIVPVRGQICALEPPRDAIQLPHSYVWTKDASDQYLIHRGLDDTQIGGGAGAGAEEGTERRIEERTDDDDDGTEMMAAAAAGGRGRRRRRKDRSLILGGERFAVPEGEEGISRDDAINPLVSRALHRGLRHAVKLRPDGEPEREALRATYEWTGIMGYSRDGHPWIGRVPATVLLDETTADADARDDVAEGLWISAGFTGHGMPVAPRCGIAVAEMMLGKKEGGVVEVVPAAWIPSPERIAKARLMRLPRTLEDLIRSLPSE